MVKSIHEIYEAVAGWYKHRKNNGLSIDMDEPCRWSLVSIIGDLFQEDRDLQKSELASSKLTIDKRQIADIVKTWSEHLEPEALVPSIADAILVDLVDMLCDALQDDKKQEVGVNVGLSKDQLTLLFWKEFSWLLDCQAFERGSVLPFKLLRIVGPYIPQWAYADLQKDLKSQFNKE